MAAHVAAATTAAAYFLLVNPRADIAPPPLLSARRRTGGHARRLAWPLASVLNPQCQPPTCDARRGWHGCVPKDPAARWPFRDPPGHAPRDGPFGLHRSVPGVDPPARPSCSP